MFFRGSFFFIISIGPLTKALQKLCVLLCNCASPNGHHRDPTFRQVVNRVRVLGSGPHTPPNFLERTLRGSNRSSRQKVTIKGYLVLNHNITLLYTSLFTNIDVFLAAGVVIPFAS